MRNFYILFTFVFFGYACKAQESFIEILGKTNINSFRCINQNIREVNWYLNDKNFNRKLPEISLQVSDFDCQNRLITKDFKNFLDAKNYPNLVIRFLFITKNSTNTYRANLEVNMMNRRKIYAVDLTYYENKLLGNKTVKFSDFGIEPPKKMAGMIMVKDPIDLVFSLKTSN